MAHEFEEPEEGEFTGHAHHFNTQQPPLYQHETHHEGSHGRGGRAHSPVPKRPRCAQEDVNMNQNGMTTDKEHLQCRLQILQIFFPPFMVMCKKQILSFCWRRVLCAS